jgi:hypothetical protein
LLLKDCRYAVAAALFQSLGDLLVRQSGKAQATGIAHVGGEIAPGHVAERGDQVEQAAVGAVAEEDTMPFVLEVEAPGHVAPGLLEPPVDLAQALQPLLGWRGREPEGEGLQGAEEIADLPELYRVERADPEAATHGGLEDAFARQSEQGLPNGGATDAQTSGQLGIADSRTGGKLSGVDAAEDEAVGLIPEGHTRYHGRPSVSVMNKVFCIQYTSRATMQYLRFEASMSARALALLALAHLPLAHLPAGRAQSEAALKEYFEGRTVTLKIAMPGTEDGVDIYADSPKPLDFPRHADRLKDYGTALRAGDKALVTKLKVKSKLIEFQLDGGGYGTMGDETSSNVNVGNAPKTKREQNLEAELKREKDAVRRRELKEELDDLKARREREDSRNRASVAEAEESKKANIRQRRIEGGSRFNLRYRDGVPASAITPQAIKDALAAYVDFGETASTPSPLAPALPVGATGPVAKPGPAGLPAKGMLQTEVDELLGPPQRTSDRMEGRLKVTTRVYSTKAGQVTTEFIEGVLIRYSMTSN